MPMANIKTVLYIHETACFSGAEESLFNLVRFLDRERFSSVFVLPEDGPFSKKLEAIGVTVFLSPMPRVRNLAGVIAAAGQILGIAVKNDAVLVHTNSIRSHLYGAYAAKRAKVPLVWHERNLVTTEIIDPERALAFLPDAIICNSQAIARRFLVRGSLPEKVSVIHNGVDSGRFNQAVNGMKIREELGIGADEVVIGMASRFNQDKGHATFLRSAQILLQSMPDRRRKMRFLVAGGAVFSEDGPREAAVRRLACELGIEDRVVFTGFRDDMPEVYAAMDIFVLASDAEPCGRVLFEAMAAGKPLVATATGGTPEIVVEGETGSLVAPRDARALSSTLVELVCDEQKRKMLGRMGRKRVEDHFTIQEHVRRTEALYEKLLRKDCE